MKRRLLLVAICSVICLCALVLVNAQPQKQPHRYQLVWQEDFNEKQLDRQCWSLMTRRQSNAGRYFAQHSALYKLKNGYIRLYGRVNTFLPSDTAKYLTCGIETRHKKTIGYGKVEVRARIHAAKGAWPAIWLRGDEKKYETYPDYAELDIVEYLNHDSFVYQTVHTNYIDKLKIKDNPQYFVKSDVKASKWNVYGVEILPDMIVYSVNGKETLRYPRIKTDKEGQYPFGCQMHLMLDMQIGGNWVGEIDPKDFPAYMDIDWVKFYESVDQD